jgi:hypothetical protein
MNSFILKLIMFCHILVISFVVLVPFLNNNYLLLLHSIFIPFMILHWVLNDNTCALTLAEQYVREQLTGKPMNKDECFMSHLINPIYDFKADNEDMSSIIYLVTIGLWLTSIGKLYFKYQTGEITCLLDILKS